MFSEPQTLTIGAAAKTLARIAFGDRTGTFESSADGLRLRISHILGKRTRRSARADFTKTAADPLLDGVSRQYGSSVSFAIDHPPVGFNATELETNAKALITWLNTGDNLKKLINGES